MTEAATASPRAAVVTGGAGGVGLACARRLGRTRPVLVADVAPDALATAVATLRDEGVDASAVTCEVADSYVV